MVNPSNKDLWQRYAFEASRLQPKRFHVKPPGQSHIGLCLVFHQIVQYKIVHIRFFLEYS